MADDKPDTPQETTLPAQPLAGGQALHLSDETPSPASVPGKPLEEKGGQGKVLVRTRYPVDRFEHNVKGVDPITAHGIEVDRAKAKDLLKAAEAVGLELEEVEQNA